MIAALITLLVVYYNAPDYDLEVFEYPEKKFEIEVTCAEGVTDCKEEPKEDCREQIKEIIRHRSMGSYDPCSQDKDWTDFSF